MSTINHPSLDTFHDLSTDNNEDLPIYSPNTAPVYSGGEFEVPLLIYHLRSVNRKLDILVPFGPTSTPSYQIQSTSTFRLFSKKPDIEVFRTGYSETVKESVAAIRFEDNGILPWRPRAYFSYKENIYHMESTNFSDWMVSLAGVAYIWCLANGPMSLVLVEKSTMIVIARFVYSEHGTMATNGSEVGELVIYRDGLTMSVDGVEMIVCGLVVAVKHFKRMGRCYSNASLTRAGEGWVSRTYKPLRRVAALSDSSM